MKHVSETRNHRDRLRRTSVGSFSTAESERTLHVLDFDYVYDEAPLDRFERRHGAVVEVETVANSAEAIDRLRSDPTPDIAALGNYAVPQALDRGMLAPLDADQVDGYGSVFDELKRDYFSRDGEVYAMPRSFGQTPLCYRTDRVASEPESWSALWNGDIDRVMLRDDAQLTALYASAAANDGAPEPLDHLGDDRLRDTFVDALAHVDRVWRTADDSRAFFRRLAPVSAGPMWRFAAVQLRRRGEPIDIAYPSEGTKAWFIQFVRPAGGHDTPLARSFIEAWYDWLGWETLMQPLGIAIPSRTVFERYDADIAAYGLDEFDRFVKQLPLSPATVDRYRRAWREAKSAVGLHDE